MKNCILLLIVAHFMIGCSGVTSKDGAKYNVYATQVAQKITLDGWLDEPAWEQAKEYSLGLNGPADEAGQSALEGGTVRLLWDDIYLYLGVTLTDSDVVQEDDRDQQHHYQTGDVLELFLKPADRSYYWEFYVTPNGRKTAFFYPGRGRLGLPSGLDYHSDLAVATQIDGTLNNWRERDKGWTAEMRVPLDELTRQGIEFGPGASWQVLIGRYNYSAYLPNRELSMFPPQPVFAFHMHEHWADLILGPAEHIDAGR